MTVTLSASDGQLTMTPATVTFTPSTWSDVQSVTIEAVQDVRVEGEHIGNVEFAISSTDIAYSAGTAATPGSEPVTISDDDLAGITIVEVDGTNITEAGATASLLRFSSRASPPRTS